MKKIFFGVVLVVVIAVGAMTNVNLNRVGNHNYDLALANVDAIASCEVTSSDGKSILNCTGSGSCTKSYLGYTLTCTGTKN